MSVRMFPEYITSFSVYMYQSHYFFLLWINSLPPKINDLVCLVYIIYDIRFEEYSPRKLKFLAILSLEFFAQGHDNYVSP